MRGNTNTRVQGNEELFTFSGQSEKTFKRAKARYLSSLNSSLNAVTLDFNGQTLSSMDC